MTLEEKLEERRGYVKASFAFMILLPLTAMCMLMFGIDPSPASGIFATASATFASVIVGHFATTPKDDKEI